MIAEHLVSEVRRLQALVNERDMRLKAMDEGREGDADKVVALQVKVKQLEEERGGSLTSRSRKCTIEVGANKLYRLL